MPRHTLLALSLALALAHTARAQDAERQPEVIVTATRVAQTVDATLAGVSIIEREQIDASGAPDLLELLRLQPGVELARTGGSGQQTSVFLRGSNPNHVLVLVDGVRVASANTGAFAWEQLPLDAVERVEIVRGPRASYWGSDAIGGVIQIFTRKLTGPRLSARYGSYEDARGDAGYGAWKGDEGFSVQAGLRHVRGFSSTNPGICSGPNDPYCPYNADDDGYRSKHVEARGAVHAGNQLLSASLLRNDAEVAYDQGHSFAIEQAAAVNVEGELAHDWTHRLTLSNDREDLRSPDYGTLYLSRRTAMSWLNTLQLSKQQQFVAGVDLVHDKGENRDLYSGNAVYQDRRDNSAVFVGWNGHRDRWLGEVAARYDHNSEFGSHGTASGALGLVTSDTSRVTLSYGTAFRGPNLNEQFHPGYGGYYAGNPDLDPETSRTAELAFEWRPDAAQRFEARAFSSRVHNLIAYAGIRSQATNIAEARIDGAELTYALQLQAWNFSTSYTWQDAKNETTDSPLLRRARNKLAAEASYRFSESFSAGVDALVSGRRTDYAADLAGYGLVNLHASWQVNEAWRLTARAENLTDRDYELVHGYNTPGRSGWLEVVWQPQGH